jgi:hypothetical protein
MDVKVASRLKKAIARSVAPSVLVGDDMLIRLRSTTIGILGLVAAVGLGLVGFVSNQGWPGVIGGPLPQAPTRIVENEAISASTPAPSGTKQSSHRHRAGATSPSRRTQGGGAATAPSAAVTPAGPAGASAPHTPDGGGGQPQAPSNPSPQPPVVAQVPPDEGRPTRGSASESQGPTTSPSGHSGDWRGKSNEVHGRSGEAPGHASGSPGHSEEASDRAGSSPGHSGKAPGHSDGSPGHSGDAPGHAGGSHGGRH